MQRTEIVCWKCGSKHRGRGAEFIIAELRCRRCGKATLVRCAPSRELPYLMAFMGGLFGFGAGGWIGALIGAVVGWAVTMAEPPPLDRP